MASKTQLNASFAIPHVSYSLNFLKEGYIGDHIGSSMGLLRGIRFLDYGSHDFGCSN